MSVCLWWKIWKKKKENQPEDGLDPPVPSTSPLPVSRSTPDIDIGSIDLTTDTPKLNHQTKNRARRTKNVRPTTRQSEMPRTPSTDILKVDENVDEFFSKPTTPLPKVSEKKESPARTPRGGLLAKLHGSPKSSPSPKKSRISNVQEEQDDVSVSSNNSNVLTRSTTENTSLRGSMDKKSAKQNDEQTAVPKSTSENISLSGSIGRKSNKSDSSSKKSEDSDSLRSDKSGSLDRTSVKSRDRSPVNVSETESEETAGKKEENEKAGEKLSESDTEVPPEKEADKDKSEVEDDKVKKVEKKPLHPPSTKKSFNKADSKKETRSGSEKPVEGKTEEKDENKGDVKKGEEVKEVEEKETEKKEEEKGDKEETKDSEGENDKGTTEETEEKKPITAGRKPGIPGGIGFGVNIMADLKAKQETRKSQMPSKPSEGPPADQSEKQGSSTTEDKKPPFGLHKLKPVSKTVPKDSEANNNALPCKPSDNKSSEPVKSTENPVQKSKAGSVETDDKNVAPEIKTDGKVQKNSSVKEASADKPAVTPRPSGLNKPPPPMRPKPPPTSSKPTPAPRKSLSSSESAEHDEEINKPEKKAVNSGVVYESATLKMSVKDKISKFKSSANDTAANKGKPLSQSEKRESVVGQSNSNDNSKFTPSNTEPPDAGDHDLHKIGNSEMTDSGIVADSPRTMKDNLSKFDGTKELGMRKQGSLPRNLTQENAEKEAEESSKRPRSMFAVLGSRSDLKKPADVKPDIPEENDKDSPTEEVILV